MAVIEPRTDGEVLYDHHLNNKLSFQQNLLIGKNGVVRIDLPIISSGDTPKVRLYLRGMAAGASATALVHGAMEHSHGTHSHTLSLGIGQSGSVPGSPSTSSTQVGGASYSVPLTYTDVPQAVQIWIDGTEYTATIDDPNAKGATMYDSVNDDWGTNGTTAWNTGELDLSSLISWTQGDHYIELKETGGTGGVLIYVLLVN